MIKINKSMSKFNMAESVTVPSLLATVAILLGYVEYLIPIVPSVACIKLGLGNIAVLLAMRFFGTKTALFVMLTKVTLCALLFAGVGGLPYSLAGGVSSLIAMAIFCRVKLLSCAGISAVGGAIHMVAQVTVASLVTATVSVMTLMPLLLAVGTITGFFNGIIINLFERIIAKYLHTKIKYR